MRLSYSSQSLVGGGGGPALAPLRQQPRLIPATKQAPKILVPPIIAAGLLPRPRDGRHRAWIFLTPMETSTVRRVRARGLQARTSPPVGRVPSRGVRGCEISELATPHPSPLPFGRGEGVAAVALGVVYAADSSVGPEGSLHPRHQVGLGRFDDQVKAVAQQAIRTCQLVFSPAAVSVASNRSRSGSPAKTASRRSPRFST